MAFNTRYKIVEVEPNKYKVYHKRFLFFWFALMENAGLNRQINEMVYTDHYSAEDAMREHARIHHAPKFKKRSRFYNKNCYELE
jgi:hypothetical protein